jgi:glucokinase
MSTTFTHPTEPVIGVDIGGTKVAAGLVSHDGRIEQQLRVPMSSQEGPAAGLAAVISAIDSVKSKAPRDTTFRGIGICCPGPLDPNSGVVINPPNLPCWRNFPLAAEVARVYSLPVKLDNDANAAALAETRWGTGHGYRNVFYATIGTGIGTGIVFDGQVFHGRTGAAGEGGHVSIDYRGPLCVCGKRGCIEVLAAGPAIARRAREKLKENHASSILEEASGDISKVTTEMVATAYASGDALAQKILDETADLLAFWFGNMIDLIDPDIIIIGGGVASILKPLFPDMRKRIPTYSVNPRAAEVPLLMAFYGAESGIAGGGALI